MPSPLHLKVKREVTESYVYHSYHNANSLSNKHSKYCMFNFICLRNLEDSWLGPWRYLLLGELSECELLDSLVKELYDHFRCKTGADVHKSLLKVILGAAKYAYEKENHISQMVLNKGCHLHGGGNGNSKVFGKTSTEVDNLCDSVYKSILDEAQEMVETESISRRPVILVLDLEVQVCFLLFFLMS